MKMITLNGQRYALIERRWYLLTEVNETISDSLNTIKELDDMLQPGFDEAYKEAGEYLKGTDQN